MQEHVSTISSTTNPAGVCRTPDVEAAGKIAVAFAEDGAVELRRVADLRGVVPALPDREAVDFDDLIAEAFEDGGCAPPSAPRRFGLSGPRR